MQRGWGKAGHRRQSRDDFFSRIAIEPVKTHGEHFGEQVAQSHMVCRGEPAEPRQEQLIGKGARGKWQWRDEGRKQTFTLRSGRSSFAAV
jgi:hypothetical protein